VIDILRAISYYTINKGKQEENKKRTGLGQNQKFSKVSRKLNPKLP
jgi:hypothetical protein